MNWDSWLEPKNSLMAATTGRALISEAAVTVLGSEMVIRSLMIRSIRIRPMRNWFWSSSPTGLTRRLPRWSMSSAICRSRGALLSSISLRRMAMKSPFSMMRRVRSRTRSWMSSASRPSRLSTL